MYTPASDGTAPAQTPYIARGGDSLSLSPLRGEQQADVAIVGGGITGCSAALHAAELGARVVLMDGQPVKSCTVLAVMADGHEVRTVEGLAHGADLDPVQQAFSDKHGLQCGFCTPGMMMTCRALLDRNPDPSETEIRVAISGQICRCTGYENIVRAVRSAAQVEEVAR